MDFLSYQIFMLHYDIKHNATQHIIRKNLTKKYRISAACRDFRVEQVSKTRHTELHKDDFFSDNEFYNCLERIPFIISNPDYISVHKKDNSISFIKDFSAHVSVAIRISSSGSLSYRTMYPITDAQLNIT